MISANEARKLRENEESRRQELIERELNRIEHLIKDAISAFNNEIKVWSNSAITWDVKNRLEKMGYVVFSFSKRDYDGLNTICKPYLYIIW